MPVFWLASYTHGAKRTKLPGSNASIRPRLPSLPWLANLLRDNDLHEHALAVQTRSIDWDVAKSKARHNIKVHGLVHCKPGQVCGDIWNVLDREEALWSEYHLPAMAHDLVSLKVQPGCVEVFASGCIDVFADARGNYLKTRHDAVYPAGDFSQHGFLSGAPLPTILQRWGVPIDGNAAIPLLFVVEPLASLIERNAFHTAFVKQKTKQTE